MEEIKVSGTVNASAKQVWKLVSDFGSLDTFVKAVANCKTNGSGIGTIRTLTLQDGGEVTEKLESITNEDRKLEYSIVDSPMPIQNYTGTMQVRELGSNESEFIWSSTFETTEGSENEIKEALKGLYSLGVKGLQAKFS